MVITHQPVMVDEVIEYLITDSRGIYVDATTGLGGHSIEICKKIMPEGRLICLDVDWSSLEIAKKKITPFEEIVTIVKESYTNLEAVLRRLYIDKVNGILLDLGMSSQQLESSKRGFSFLKNEPLDMRMDVERDVNAGKLVNELSKERLEKIIRNFGQEKWAKRIALNITEERQKGPITSSGQLASLIKSAIPAKYHPSKIHPATKTFQALRIAVNRELENIENVLETIPQLLTKGGRLIVISYHSLEDRIVKQRLKLWEKGVSYPRKLPVLYEKKAYSMQVLIKKGLRPAQKEVEKNPRSRSAIMRIAERI